jgi:adenine-specific DNA-methyltransferase
MAERAQIEITWIGKGDGLPAEPGVLVEDVSRSYGSGDRGADVRHADNRLVFGDSLLALRALEPEFAGTIRCVYLDPPFNTGSDFAHYDDDREHSLWLGMMRDRLQVARRLLADDGALFVHLDDSESAYCKVLLDEIFGRRNYRNTICVRANSPFGFKHTANRIFKSANHLLVYAKSDAFQFNRVWVERGYDEAYRFLLEERSQDHTRWKWRPLAEVVARELGYGTLRQAHATLGREQFLTLVGDYAVAHAARVFRTAAVTGGARRKRRETLERSRRERDTVIVHPGEDMEGYYFLNGERILFYDERLVEIEGTKAPGTIVTDIWSDIAWEGIAREGQVDFPRGKKPEALIARILELATRPGDWVLDAFAGSGTTGAVAHKLRRRWIMIEIGEQCHTHILPRLRRVVDGTDPSGVTRSAGWTGGGGFRYFSLAAGV